MERESSAAGGPEGWLRASEGQAAVRDNGHLRVGLGWMEWAEVEG